jgi:hypothetical protein
MLLAFALLIVLMIAIIAVAIGRRRAKRAGIGPNTPVCANCLYPLGGWSSPTCPECGSNVMRIGVRIGPQTPRQLLIALICIAGVFGTGLFATTGFGWIFETRHTRWHSRWMSKDMPRYYVTMAGTWNWKRFPRSNELVAEIDFVRLEGLNSGSWMNGKWTGSKPLARQTITFNAGDDVPTIEAIKQAVEAMTPESTPELRVQQAENIWMELHNIWSSADDGTLHQRNHAASPAGNLFSGGSGGRSQRRWVGWQTPVLSVLAVIVFIVLGVRWVNRTYRPGWRKARVGEWEMFRRESAGVIETALESHTIRPSDQSAVAADPHHR